MSTLKQLIREAHRRSIWQVLAIYMAGSFGALQVVDLVSKNVGLPEWTTPFAVILLVIGFPIVMATAFVQEGGPSAIVQRPVAEPGGTLAAAAQPDPPATPDAPGSHGGRRPRAHRWFTWRNALGGGVAAFALLGASTAGYMGMRSLGIPPFGTLVAQGVLPERATIVIADLGSTTGDTLVARAATEALRVDLAQSPNVRILEPRQIADALRRMQRSVDEPLSVTLATEVAVREGAAAIVAGEINGVGRGFVLTASIIGAGEGVALSAVRENARDSAEVIRAIDRMSNRLRERLGESYRSLRQGQPLDRVTTASLEALRKYSLGSRAIDVTGDESRGIALLEEAVRLDTAFAMAYRKLGITLGNEFRERARAVDAMTRAYQHRDRLTPRERYLAEASYFTSVDDDPGSAILAYESMLELDSADSYALNNLGVIHSRIGDAARAEHYYRRSIEADSSNTLAYGNVLGALVRQGKFEEAEAILARFGARFPGNLRHTESRARLASSRGDYDTAERIYRALRDSLPANLGVRTATTQNLSHLAAVRGRLNDARSLLSELISLYEGRDQPDQSLQYSIDAAALDLYARDRPADAVARVDEALRRYPLAQLHPLERPYGRLIGIYADAGQAARARALLDEYDTTVSPRLRAWDEREILRSALTSLMSAEGDANAAADSATVWLRTSACARCLLPTLARALEAAGRADSAIVVYERYIEEPGAQRTALLDRWYLGPVLERVAQLHDQRADAQRAARFYARFVELWQTADPELQPRVGAARARLEQLTRTRG